MQKTYSRGEIYYADLSPAIGCEQNGKRPVLIISNNIGNRKGPTVIVAAITSKIEVKEKLPTHICINEGNGLIFPSVILLEQIRTIDKQRLDDYIGMLNLKQMYRVNQAIQISLDVTKKNVLSETATPSTLLMCLCRTCLNNFAQTNNYDIRRKDYGQKNKDDCDYCNTRVGWDYILTRLGGNAYD